VSLISSGLPLQLRQKKKKKPITAPQNEEKKNMNKPTSSQGYK
jgi:hypothetical protein